MRVLVVGSKGNMGRRYIACLNHFSVPWTGFDIKDGVLEPERVRDCSHAIIATPTAQHIEDIDRFAEFGIPLLVEKPIACDAKAVETAVNRWRADNVRVTMINQYAYVARQAMIGHTYYNFYKTGDDSLAWDCMNVIGTAESDVYIANDSPIWTCCLNGFSLTIRDIDISYLTMINDFLESAEPNYDYMIRAHHKAQAYKEAFLGKH